jgi:toxin ParE1/3/4
MKLRIRPEARQDLRNIGDYIAHDNRQAARQFVTMLRGRCAFLAENPRVGRERSDLCEGLRSFPVQNYVIFYRILDQMVEIVNVIHGSRDIESLF